MRARGGTFLLSSLLLSLALLASSAQAQPPTLTIPRVDAPPTLDQFAGGAITPPGIVVEGFRQREPGDGDPVSRPTTAYVSYDERNLYVVFVCRDDPASVRARMSRRESIGDDDRVGLILDTWHDGRRAYMFLANPLGIQQDGVTIEGQNDDYTFDTLWHSEGRLTPDGYIVLMAIPFRSLRFAGSDRQTWGLALGRVIHRLNEVAFWPYVTRRIAGLGPQMATLEGVEGVSPGRNLQAIPYASFARARELGGDGRRATDTTGRVGVDGKAVFRDAVTLDLTVNPDFSQVESDEPQVTVNQRFEVFFPEKRPFFIENANYFVTPQRLFFSRRIADPDLGARVTGRSRGWSFGALVTDDGRPGEAVAPTDPRHGKGTFAGVARVQREFARQSSLGAIVTAREFGGSHNRVVGVDGRWKIRDTWSVDGQWVASDTREPGAPGASGTSAYGRVARDGRGFDFSSEVLARSPDFRADLGFVTRVDMIENENEVGYQWFPKSSRVLRVGTDFEAGALWDYGGELQEWVVEPGAEIELAGQTQFGVRHWQDMEKYRGEEFRYGTTAAYASSSWLKWLSLDGFYRWGTGINYDPAGELRPFLGARRHFEGGVTLRPSSQLRFDQRYIYSRLASRDGDLEGVAGGRAVFDNHILRSRANYQFTREWSARVILDYQAVLPDTSLVALDRSKRLTGDVLVTYLVNPWTALYVGYTDAYANFRVEPRSGLVRAGGPTTSTGRQVFVKVSYLLRY